MDLILVRHGESEGNKRRFVQGWMDTALTPLGQRQAALVAERMREFLPLNAIYASPLRRAWETASAIATVAKMLLHPDVDLREMHFGEVEGLTDVEWRARYPDLMPRWADRSDLDFGWPGGETRRQFADRIAGAINRVISQRPHAERLLVVCHGGAISTYLSTILHDTPSHWRDYQVGNCSISLVRFSGAAPELVLFNDESHLGSADTEDETADDEVE